MKCDVFWSYARRIVIDHDGLPFAVDVERFGARLPKTVARILHAAKRHVRTGAVCGAIDRDETGAVACDELLDAAAVERVNRAREPEGGRVRERDRGVESGNAIQTGNGAELLLLRQLVAGRDVLENRRRHVVARRERLHWMAPGQYPSAARRRALDGAQQSVEGRLR